MRTSAAHRRSSPPRGAAIIAVLVALAVLDACAADLTQTPPAPASGPGGLATATAASTTVAPPGGPSTGVPSLGSHTPTPTARPLACRGAIPASTSALRGPLRAPVGPVTTATIWYVVDGDTIRLTDKAYVRLIGMDTPETVKPGTPVQPYGPQASADAKALLAGHLTVTLEQDVSDTDHYGRLLRFVWYRDGGIWYQLDYELVVRGDARLDTVKPDIRYAADYAAAQAVAQAHHVGRWATC